MGFGAVLMLAASSRRGRTHRPQVLSAGRAGRSVLLPLALPPCWSPPPWRRRAGSGGLPAHRAARLPRSSGPYPLDWAGDQGRDPLDQPRRSIDPALGVRQALLRRGRRLDAGHAQERRNRCAGRENRHSASGCWWLPCCCCSRTSARPCLLTAIWGGQATFWPACRCCMDRRAGGARRRERAWSQLISPCPMSRPGSTASSIPPPATAIRSTGPSKPS